jgi:hypothetical protein
VSGPAGCGGIPASHPRTAGACRIVSTIVECTQARCTAATTARASSTVPASGFSQIRCFPAAAASRASRPCTSGGTAKATASTASNNTSMSA